MHINKVPSDIISLILRKASTKFHDFNFVKIWKRSLPLLAVCQNWRQLAIRHVYTYAVVTTNRTNNDNEYSSNLQLIIGAQASQHTKRLKIVIVDKSNPQQILEAVVKLMALSSLGWNNVNELDLLIPEVYDSPEDSICALVKQFAVIIPNIDNLSIRKKLRGASLLFSGLVDTYILQLKTLNSESLLQLKAPEFSRNLTKLVLKMPGNGFKIPKVCAETLYHLELIQIPSSYNWCSFDDLKENNEILFSNLEYLQVYYLGNIETTHPNNDIMLNRRCKFYFPKLQTIWLENATEDCHILKNGVFSSSIKNVKVCGSTGALVHLAQLNITCLHKLEVNQAHLIYDELEKTQATQAINELMTKVYVKIECKLTLKNTFNQLVSANIYWPHLTHFWLHTNVNATTFLQIIQQLPRLNLISTCKMNIDMAIEDISVSLPSDTQVVEPINLKITDLSFQLIHTNQKSIIIAWVRYLLMHLPLLSRFNIKGIPKDEIHKIVNSYKNVYPHLARISI